jgi:hypothetical protein
MAIKINNDTVIDNSKNFAGNNGSFTGTEAVKLPVGTTSQRPTPVSGQIRFNSEILKFEGYNGTSWGPLGGEGGGGSGEFNTNITNTVQIYPLSYNNISFTFPSTVNKKYIIESINVANVSDLNDEINIITDIGQTEKSYIAYQVPIVSGGLVELLKQPIIANPSDEIRTWTTNETFVGVNNAAEMYISYTESMDADFFGIVASNTTIPSVSPTTIYTSTVTPSMLQSIHIVNKSDDGDYILSISITNGANTTFLAKNLIIPRYATVNILDRPKRIETNGTLNVQLGQTGTIDIIVAGKKITG